MGADTCTRKCMRLLKEKFNNVHVKQQAEMLDTANLGLRLHCLKYYDYIGTVNSYLQ